MFLQIAAAVALLGGWAPEGSYCASGEAYVFNADGTFGNEDTEGTWQQREDRLTLRIGGRTSRVLVRLEAPDTISMSWPDGMRKLWRRCDGAREPWHDEIASK